jgi:hypothetical protein
VESEGLAEKYRAVIEGATLKMNRSAKDGARSSCNSGSEGVLTHPSQQGVCGRHGTEDLGVTPGGLAVLPGGAGISDPISRETKWEAMRGESSDRRIVPEGWRKPVDRASGSRVGWGRRWTEVVGARQERSE